MGKRRIRFDEDDLKIIFGKFMEDTYLGEDGYIVGFEYKTRKIKRGGDYYKDGVDDPDYPGEVEVIQWIKVLIDTKHRRKEKDDGEGEESGDDSGGSGSGG